MEKHELTVQQASPISLLETAMSRRDFDPETMGKLLDLQERWEKTQARKEFFEALSRFQSIVPEIKKDKHVKFPTSKGVTEYYHSSLPEIDRTIRKPMAECGLSKRYKFSQGNGNLKVTCIITHLSGHSEETIMEGPLDNSGNKNMIQQGGSSSTYLQRYTLIGALGLTTSDEDNDGRNGVSALDGLKKTYMDLLNPLVKKEKDRFEKFLPSNWQGKETVENYQKALRELKKQMNNGNNQGVRQNKSDKQQ